MIRDNSKNVATIINICGGHGKLAEELGTHIQTIYKWEKRNEIPISRCYEVCLLSRLPLSMVRPNLYKLYISLNAENLLQ